MKCLLCNRKLEFLPNHLKYKHNISSNEYKKLFPNAKVVSNKWHVRQSETLHNYCINNPDKLREKYTGEVRHKMCIKQAKSFILVKPCKICGASTRNYKYCSRKCFFISRIGTQNKKRGDSLRQFYQDHLEKRKEIGEKVKKYRASLTLDEKIEYNKKVFLKREPSGPESLFTKFCLDNNLPYIYVGNMKNKQLCIGGKVPDFIYKNKIIEIWGDFYHQSQNPQDRIDYFKQYGYNCIVIWASELKNKNLLDRVTSFTSKQ